MSLPQPIRAHRARPLPWMVAALVLVGVVVAFGYRGLHDHRVWARSALRVDGHVVEPARGGQLRVDYRHPVTGQRVEVEVDTWGRGDDLRRGDPVALDVDADNPERLSLAGEHKPPVDPVSLALLLAVPAAACAVRWWSVQRTLALARADAPAFALLGAVAPAGRLRRKPRLHLYPVDAAAGDAPLCAVRVLNTAGAPLGGAAFPVQVKGMPRAMGRVVARAGEEVLWPAGRADTSASLPRPDRVVEVTPPPAADPAILPAWVTTGGPFRQRSAARIALGIPLGLLALFVLLGLGATADTLFGARRADHARRDRTASLGEVVAKQAPPFARNWVDVRYRDGSRPVAVRVTVNDATEYTVGRLYPILVDGALHHPVLLAKERYPRGEQLVFGWLPAIPVALWAGRVMRTWRRSRAVARRGPWYRLELWPGPLESLHLGDQAEGYVRGAVVSREAVPALRRLWAAGAPLGPSPLWTLTPPGAPITVAGTPESGGVVALIDGDGDVYVVPERLRVPLAAPYLRPVAAAAG